MECLFVWGNAAAQSLWPGDYSSSGQQLPFGWAARTSVAAPAPRIRDQRIRPRGITAGTIASVR